jgi:hypothetical protein
MMCDGFAASVQSGEWGPEQVHPLPLGASGGEPSPQSGPDLTALPPRTLELSGPNAASVWQMAVHPVPDPIGSSRHDSFSGEPDPEPIPQLTLSCAWLILDPSYLLALAGSWVKVELSVSFFEHHLQLDYGYYRRRAANRFPAGRIPSV